MATLIEQLKMSMDQLGDADGVIILESKTVADILKEVEVLQQAPKNITNPLSDNYVQEVPDKCERIVWRGKWYNLPQLKYVAVNSLATEYSIQ